MGLLSRSGQAATALLFLAVVSGLVLAYQYEPGDPFISTVAMEAALDWGSFWRGTHFWSSQGFLVLLLLHTWYRLDGCEDSGAMKWFLLSLLVPASIFTLFSGYVLKFDATGEAAAAIAEHLLLMVPVAGRLLDRLLVSVSTEGLNRIYGVHILLTFLLWFVGTWYHTRRPVMGRGWFLASLLWVVAVSLLFPAPLDLPGHEATLIKGPWFFLGVQELLRHIPPLVAGVLIPAIPVAALSAMVLPWARRPCRWILALWLAAYAVLTIVMAQR